MRKLRCVLVAMLACCQVRHQLDNTLLSSPQCGEHPSADAGIPALHPLSLCTLPRTAHQQVSQVLQHGILLVQLRLLLGHLLPESRQLSRAGPSKPCCRRPPACRREGEAR